MEFAFDPKKNDLLLQTRGVSFRMVIEAISEKGMLGNFEHPNQAKYPNQRLLVVDLDGYSYCVPYSIHGETWFLRTIYPSRRFKHLLKGADSK